MSGDTIVMLTALSLAAVLPVLALRGRGLGLDRSLRLIAGWLAIFIVVMVFFTWWQP